MSLLLKPKPEFLMRARGNARSARLPYFSSEIFVWRYFRKNCKPRGSVARKRNDEYTERDAEQKTRTGLRGRQENKLYENLAKRTARQERRETFRQR